MVEESLHTDAQGADPAVPGLEPTVPKVVPEVLVPATSLPSGGPAARPLGRPPGSLNRYRLGRHHRVRTLSPEGEEAACKLAAHGMDAESIAPVLGERLTTVARALNKKIAQRRIAFLRGQVLLREIEHGFALPEMLPQARAALIDVMQTGDLKERSVAARWLHGALVAKPVQQTRTQIEVSGKLQHDLSPVLEQIGKHLAAIRSANVGRDPLARVRSGSEALVRPQIEAGESDAGSS